VEKTNLLGFTLPALTEWMAAQGEKPFRARQLFQWIHQRGADDFEAMTDLAKSLREKLKVIAESGRRPSSPSIAPRMDGEVAVSTWVRAATELKSNASKPSSSRKTTAARSASSSQVGCALDCKFCTTGRQGFNRDLTPPRSSASSGSPMPGEGAAGRRILLPPAPPASSRGSTVSNVVMMGMGEPLNNFDPVVARDDDHARRPRLRLVAPPRDALDLGVVPNIRKLKDTLPVAPRVSLHAPNDALRTRIMPINQAYRSRAARRMPRLPRGGAARLHHLRVRDARGRERRVPSTRASSPRCSPTCRAR
jgi:23S rRNA (adenine2503-C2)-methyltransferase